MDYGKMTDFEINCAVARAAGIAGMLFFDVDSSFCHGPVWNVPSGITEDGINISRGNPFTPCTTAAAAWPIIVDNQISIYAMGKSDARGKWGAEAPHPYDIYRFNDNPLRAAMIVYLMMQEAK